MIDPRFSICYQLTPQQYLRFSTGTYHQFPDAMYYDKHNGNPDLNPMEAKHVILGWEYRFESFLYHVEWYYKWYDHLLLNDEDTNYSNHGSGYARGIDTFIKSDYGFISGWLSYSYLQSKRKEKLYDYLVPTDYDLTHQFKMVTKIEITLLWNMSASYRYVTGRPFHGGYGLWNTKRDPDYHLLDLSLSYLTSFFRGNLTIFYLAIGNLTGRKNILSHSYSPDYDQVYTRKSFQKRTVYFGVNFGF